MLKDPLYKALMTLRADALERDMMDLAILCGWSLMRRGEEIVMAGLNKSSNGHGQQPLK